MSFECSIPIPRIVLDSNVVLNWLFFQDIPTLALMQKVLVSHTWVCTVWMQTEAIRVAKSPAMARYATPEKLANLANGFVQHATILLDASLPANSAYGLLRCRDRDDQVFLDLALYRQAQFILTLDRDLLKLKKRAATLGLSIVEPSKLVL
jgi:uncharacterized protein